MDRWLIPNSRIPKISFCCRDEWISWAACSSTVDRCRSRHDNESSTCIIKEWSECLIEFLVKFNCFLLLLQALQNQSRSTRFAWSRVEDSESFQRDWLDFAGSSEWTFLFYKEKKLLKGHHESKCLLRMRKKGYFDRFASSLPLRNRRRHKSDVELLAFAPSSFSLFLLSPLQRRQKRTTTTIIIVIINICCSLLLIVVRPSSIILFPLFIISASAASKGDAGWVSILGWGIKEKAIKSKW